MIAAWDVDYVCVNIVCCILKILFDKADFGPKSQVITERWHIPHCKTEHKSTRTFDSNGVMVDSTWKNNVCATGTVAGRVDLGGDSADIIEEKDIFRVIGNCTTDTTI